MGSHSVGYRLVCEGFSSLYKLFLFAKDFGVQWFHACCLFQVLYVCPFKTISDEFLLWLEVFNRYDIHTLKIGVRWLIMVMYAWKHKLLHIHFGVSHQNCSLRWSQLSRLSAITGRDGRLLSIRPKKQRLAGTDGKNGSGRLYLGGPNIHLGPYKVPKRGFNFRIWTCSQILRARRQFRHAKGRF
jgi:hypothetical protein